MEETKRSNLSLWNREKLTLTGVVEVICFDEERILLTTNLGTVEIKGENLKMNKLDVHNGDVSITGLLNSFGYSNKDITKSKENLLKKIFK